MGKVEKTRFDRIGRRSSTRLFALLGKAGLTNVVQLRSKRVFSTFPIGAKPKKHPWNSNSTTSVSCHFWAFPQGKNGLKRRPKNAFFRTQLDDVRQPGFLPCLEKPTQNGGMKPTSWNSIPRVFFRFAPMGKVEKTRFERNWTTFVNPAFCPAWKSPLKMVV